MQEEGDSANNNGNKWLKIAGATDFYTGIRKTDQIKTAEEAFQVATNNAKYDDGNDGYTGTIAEKNSYIMVGKTKTANEAKRMAKNIINNGDPRIDDIDDKYGPAGCIEFDEPPGWIFFDMASE